MSDPATESIDSSPGSRSRGDADTLPAGARVGSRYVIREVIGTGGFAIVYSAWDEELRTDVALKILRIDRTTPSSIARLRREVLAARKAESPQLVRIFDVGQSDGLTFVSMELVHGGSLRDRLSDGALPIDESLRIATDLMRGLAALHREGLVHRDVKPGNILMRDDGGVKLADFGLVKELESDETQATRTEAVIGTFEYVSPEQALNETVDARSDLYSAGILLFEMLTGDVPHRRATSIGTIAAHLHARVPDVCRLRRDAPRWLARIAKRLLERDPANRYASADEVLADLEARRFRSPKRAALIRIAIGVSVLLLTVAAALAFQSWYFSRFASITLDGEFGMRALDRRGRLLWSNPQLHAPHRAAVARLDEGKAYVVGFRWTREAPLAGSQQLEVFSAQTGEHVRTILLPEAHVFYSWANLYSPTMRIVDLDGDAVDEIVVTYNHRVYYPSYAVVYFPREDFARPVYIAAGHQLLIGAFDVNGDGRRELIFSGIANLIGWNRTIAAVDAGERTRDDGFDPSVSPELDAGWTTHPRRPYWLLLVPNGGVAQIREEGTSVALAPEQLSVRAHDGSAIRIARDGFVDPSPLPPTERATARAFAYEKLAEARRRSTASLYDDAFEAVNEARTAAARASDRGLSEWVERVNAMYLIGAGRHDEAEAAYSSLVEASVDASDIAFEAGREFHRTGALRRAADWYARGIAVRSDPSRGRIVDEYLQNAVLALVELGDYAGATKLIDASGRSAHQSFAGVEYYRQYIRWRLTGEAKVPETKVDAWSDNLIRYWNLEFRYSSGTSDHQMLTMIDSIAPQLSTVDPMMASLRSVVLLDLGRGGEAAEEALTALRTAEATRRSEVAVRAHFDLIVDRAVKAARSAPDSPAAKSIHAELGKLDRVSTSV